ncbi:MAG: hypothetical protein WC759_03095, partial [Candidatus Micrarchaeia archaeon]
MVGAYKEPSPSRKPEVPVEVQDAYGSMRKEVIGAIDHNISLLNTYVDYFDKMRSQSKGHEKAKWDSLYLMALGNANQLRRLKEDMPSANPTDYGTAVATVFNSAVLANRMLSTSYSALWTEAPLPQLKGADLEFFLYSVSNNMDTLSHHIGELTSQEYFKSDYGNYTYGGKFKGQDGKDYVHLLSEELIWQAESDYGGVRLALDKAMKLAQGGDVSGAYSVLQGARKDALDTNKAVGEHYSANLMNYEVDKKRAGLPWYSNAYNFMQDNPWIGDLAVVGIAVAAELGTAGLATPVVAAATGGYFIARGSMEVMSDIDINGRLTMQGAMGAMMALTPVGKIAGLFGPAKAVLTGANAVSTVAGGALVIGGLWDAGTILATPNKYGYTMADLEALGINFSFLALGATTLMKSKPNAEISKGIETRDFSRVTTELDRMLEQPKAKTADLVREASEAIDDIGGKVKSRDGRLELAERAKDYTELAKKLRSTNDPTLTRLADFMDSEMARAAKQAEAKGLAGKSAKYFTGTDAKANVSALEDAYYALGTQLATKYLGLLIARIQNGDAWGSADQLSKYSKAGLTGEQVLGAYQTKQRYNAGQNLLATQAPDVLLKRAATLRAMGDPTTADFVEAAVKTAQKPAASGKPVEELQAIEAKPPAQPQLQLMEASAEGTWASWRKAKAPLDHVTTGNITYAARADQAVGERTWLKLEMQNGRLVPVEVISAEDAAGIRVSARVMGLENGLTLAVGRQVAKLPKETEGEGQTYEEQQAAQARRSAGSTPAAEGPTESTRQTVRGRQPGGSAIDIGPVRLRTGEKPPGAKPMPTVEFTTEQLVSMTSTDLATIRSRNGRYATIQIEGMDPVSGSLRTEYRGKGANRKLYVSVDRTNKVFWPVDMLQKLVLDPVEAGKATAIPADTTATRVKPGRRPIEGQTYKMRLQRPFGRAETVEGAFTDENLAAMRQWEGKIVAVYGKNGEMLAMGKLRIGSVNAEDKTFQITQLDPSWGAPREGRMPNIRARTTFRFDEVGKVDMLDWKIFPSINLMPLVVDRTYKTKQEISEGTYGTSLIRIRDGQTQSTYFARRIDKVTMSDGTVKYEMIAVPCMRMQAGIGQLS